MSEEYELSIDYYSIDKEQEDKGTVIYTVFEKTNEIRVNAGTS